MFEGPGLHFLVVAVQEGALGSRALHIIHMDESCTCRGESMHGMDLKPFLTIIKKRQHFKSPHMGGPKHRVLFQATRRHRLADYVTQTGTHTDTQDCVYFQLNFAFIFRATMKTCLGKMIFFFFLHKSSRRSTLVICHTSVQLFCCWRNSSNGTSARAQQVNVPLLFKTGQSPNITDYEISSYCCRKKCVFS